MVFTLYSGIICQSKKSKASTPIANSVQPRSMHEFSSQFLNESAGVFLGDNSRVAFFSPIY